MKIAKPVTVHNLLLVDESASMQKLHKVAIDSINDTILSIKEVSTIHPNQEQKLSLFTFNGLGIKMHIFNKVIDKVTPLGYSSFRPNSKTPLLDCIGQSIGMLRSAGSHKKNEKVVVTILTDGDENGSQKYTFGAIHSLISQMRNMGWIFNYIGANHDVKSVCNNLNISNYYIFKNEASGLIKQMSLERMARKKYYAELSKHKLNDNVAA